MKGVLRLLYELVRQYVLLLPLSEYFDIVKYKLTLRYMANVYYKVTNVSAKPLTRTWNRALLDPEDKVLLDEYMQTADFLGRDNEEKNKKKKVAPEIRLRPFFDQLGKDVRVKVYDPTRSGHVVRFEWRWMIGPNTGKLKDLGRLEVIGICDEFNVKSEDKTVKQMIKGLVEKYGSNERYLSSEQWEESGLMDLQVKDITLELQPGEKKSKIVTEGFLEVETLSKKQYLEATKDEKGKD